MASRIKQQAGLAATAWLYPVRMKTHEKTRQDPGKIELSDTRRAGQNQPMRKPARLMNTDQLFPGRLLPGKSSTHATKLPQSVKRRPRYHRQPLSQNTAQHQDRRKRRIARLTSRASTGKSLLPLFPPPYSRRSN